MGTSLTAEYWERFALLMGASLAITFVLSWVCDALVLRWLRRRVSRPPVQEPQPPQASGYPPSERSRL